MLILASASPRRREILADLGLEPAIAPADVDEQRLDGESPLELVERLARDKARACYASRKDLRHEDVIIAADTIVWTGNEVFGKPGDVADAKAMLKRLSNNTHCVSTGVCLTIKDESPTPVMRSFVETTHVRFYDLTEGEIDSYVATGEPMDKAGAYGIQDRARLFVRAIEGDYYNVVGLPVARMVRELSSLSPGFAGLPERLMRHSHM